jgi:hypothetical protein
VTESSHLANALADRYRIERELGAGGDGDGLSRTRRPPRPESRLEGVAPGTRRGDWRRAVPPRDSGPPPTSSIPISSRSSTRARSPAVLPRKARPRASSSTSCPMSRVSRSETGLPGDIRKFNSVPLCLWCSASPARRVSARRSVRFGDPGPTTAGRRTHTVLRRSTDAETPEGSPRHRSGWRP